MLHFPMDEKSPIRLELAYEFNEFLLIRVTGKLDLLYFCVDWDYIPILDEFALFFGDFQGAFGRKIPGIDDDRVVFVGRPLIQQVKAGSCVAESRGANDDSWLLNLASSAKVLHVPVVEGVFLLLDFLGEELFVAVEVACDLVCQPGYCVDIVVR